MYVDQATKNFFSTLCFIENKGKVKSGLLICL